MGARKKLHDHVFVVRMPTELWKRVCKAAIRCREVTGTAGFVRMALEKELLRQEGGGNGGVDHNRGFG
jgi:hypothetical protein